MTVRVRMNLVEDHGDINTQNGVKNLNYLDRKILPTSKFKVLQPENQEYM